MVKVFEIIVKHLVDVPGFLKEHGGDIIEKGIFLTDKVELVRWLQAAGHKINNVLDYADDGEDNDSQPTITMLIWKGIEKVAEKIDDVVDLVDNLKDDDSFKGATETVHKIKNIGTEEEVVEIVEQPVKEEPKTSIEFVQLSDLENMVRHSFQKFEKKFATVTEVDIHFKKLSTLMDQRFDLLKDTPPIEIQPCAETEEIKKAIDDIRKKVKVLHKTSKDLDSRITKLENPPDLEDEQTFDDSNDPAQLLAEPEIVMIEEEPITIPEPVKPKKTDKEEIDKELLEKVEKIVEG